MEALPCAKAHNLGSSTFPLKSLTKAMQVILGSHKKSVFFAFYTCCRTPSTGLLLSLENNMRVRWKETGDGSCFSIWMPMEICCSCLGRLVELKLQMVWPAFPYKVALDTPTCFCCAQASLTHQHQGRGWIPVSWQCCCKKTAKTAEENAFSLSTNQVFFLRPQTAVLAFPWKHTPLCSWNAQKKHILMKTKMRC